MHRRDDIETLNRLEEAATDAMSFMLSFEESGFKSLPAVDRKAFRAVRDALSEAAEALGDLPSGMVVRHAGFDPGPLLAAHPTRTRGRICTDVAVLWEAARTLPAALDMAVAEKAASAAPGT